MQERTSKCPKCAATNGLSAIVRLRSELKLPVGIDPEEVQVLAGQHWQREDQIVCSSCGYAGEWQRFAVRIARPGAKAA